MNAVFADDPSDPRYREAVAAERKLTGARIVTKDEESA